MNRFCRHALLVALLVAPVGARGQAAPDAAAPTVEPVTPAVPATAPVDSTVSPAAPATVEFTDDRYGYALRHPADWKADRDGRNVPTLAATLQAPADHEDDRFFERLTVQVVDMRQEADINELVDKLKPQAAAQAPPGYAAQSDERTSVAGLPARRLVGRTPAQGTTAITTQWMFVAGQRLYILTYTTLSETDARYAPVGRAIVESFKLTG
jgi:hypothetical protein